MSAGSTASRETLLWSISSPHPSHHPSRHPGLSLSWPSLASSISTLIASLKPSSINARHPALMFPPPPSLPSTMSTTTITSSGPWPSSSRPHQFRGPHPFGLVPELAPIIPLPCREDMRGGLLPLVPPQIPLASPRLYHFVPHSSPHRLSPILRLSCETFCRGRIFSHNHLLSTYQSRTAQHACVISEHPGFYLITQGKGLGCPAGRMTALPPQVLAFIY